VTVLFFGLPGVSVLGDQDQVVFVTRC